jgi:hypothetical protein
VSSSRFSKDGATFVIRCRVGDTFSVASTVWAWLGVPGPIQNMEVQVLTVASMKTDFS